MDPDETLAQIRLYVTRILDPEDGGDEIDALALATLVDNVDKWLTKGGFLPKVWQH